MFTFLQQLYNKYFATYEAAYLLLVLFVLLIVSLTDIINLLVPFICALVIAYLLQGGVSFLINRLGLRPLHAVLLTFFIFMVAFVGLVLLIAPLLYEQTIAFLASLPKLIPQWLQLIKTQIDYIPGLGNVINMPLIAQQIQNLFDSSLQILIVTSVNNIDALMVFFAYLVIVPTVVFFMLKDRQLLLNACYKLLPHSTETRTRLVGMLHEIDGQLTNYIRGKLLECFVVGVATYVIFIWFNLQYAELLAFVVGLSVFIPYFGIVVVTVPVALIAISQFGFTSNLYWLLSIYVALHLLDANLLVPVLFSEAVKIHPILIILAIIISAGLWGVWGVFFAIPIAVFIKALISNWPLTP